jgi:hypothetical protein
MGPANDMSNNLARIESGEHTFLQDAATRRVIRP